MLGDISYDKATLKSEGKNSIQSLNHFKLVCFVPASFMIMKIVSF